MSDSNSGPAPSALSNAHHGNGKTAPLPAPLKRPPLLKSLFAETLGTFILVFFGCGAVHAAVLTGAQQGLWQVAIVWGLGITLAIYITADASGAHLNPAITLALTVFGRAPFRRMIPYMAFQFLGAAAAAGMLYLLFAKLIVIKEEAMQVYRGQPGSEAVAMCYGEYFPNPQLIAEKPHKDDLEIDLSTGDPRLAERGFKGVAKYKVAPATLDLYKRGNKKGLDEQVSAQIAFAAEVFGTAILALVIFAVTDPRNRSAPGANLAPVFIGLTVAVLISVIAPLTQACFNPARDFGPRAVAYCLGWRRIAWPGWRGNEIYLVYALAPALGALLGGGLYEKVLRRNEGA